MLEIPAWKLNTLQVTGEFIRTNEHNLTQSINLFTAVLHRFVICYSIKRLCDAINRPDICGRLSLSPNITELNVNISHLKYLWTTLLASIREPTNNKKPIFWIFANLVENSYKITLCMQESIPWISQRISNTGWNNLLKLN